MKLFNAMCLSKCPFKLLHDPNRMTEKEDSENTKTYLRNVGILQEESKELERKQDEFKRRAPFMQPDERAAAQKAFKQLNDDFNYKLVEAVYASEKWLITEVFPNELDKFTVFTLEEADRVIKDQVKLKQFKQYGEYQVIKETKEQCGFDLLLKSLNMKIWTFEIK